MIRQIRDVFTIPSNISEEYWTHTVRSNHRILVILSTLCMAAQLFNIYRVLFTSDSGLGTVNNRIYFSFYCVMLAGCGAFLVLSPWLKHRPKFLGALQSAAMTFWILWCAGLNCYDIYGNPEASNGTFITALLGAAVCIQTVPWFAVINFIGSTIIFHWLTSFALDFSYMWNCVLSMGVAIVVCYARSRYTVSNILNQQEIIKINGKLTEEKEKLNLTLQKYGYILRQTNNIIFDWNVDTGAVEFSESWTQNFDYPAYIPDFSQWLKTSTIMSEKEKDKLLARIRKAMEESGQLETEISLHDKNGICSWYLLHLAFQKDSDGHIKSGVGYLTDINKHKNEVCQLKFRAKTDVLTGLMNRGAIEEYMLARRSALTSQDMMVMAILDVDNFKYVNDTYGHPCGDKVLAEVGQMLRDRFREGDGIGRIGGDEFMVVFVLKKNMGAVKKKLEKISGAAKPVIWENTQINVSISVGAAVWDGDSFDSLYKRADHALYVTKQKHKGGYTIL